MGHAWEALALTARAMGCDTFAYGCFADDEIAQACRLNADEWPMLVVQIRGAIPRGERDGGATIWHGGQANPLSTEPIVYAPIEEMHAVTKLIVACEADVGAPAQGSGEIQLPAPASSARAFGEVARTRRSALDFRGGSESISLAQLSAILAETARPFAADFGDGRFVQLYLYAHRVDGLDPGVYRYWSSSAQLERIRSGDQRVAAAGLSLGQDLAGNACVAFSMIADLDRATRMYGDRGYRYAHFEAGAIGQRLYIAAEGSGLGATGIGAFFDDEVHRCLGIPPEQGQVIYHFAIGYPVSDPRVEARA
jgi:SagB-type dehydrogenase family enzyme